MPQIQLTPAQRKAHRSDAHHLDPVVHIGNDGLTAAVRKETDAAPIQHIGKLLVLWRPIPEKEKALDEDRKPGPRDVKILKYSKKGGQRPEVKTVRVLGNERLTPGGLIKRAKKAKPKSVKKTSQG